MPALVSILLSLWFSLPYGDGDHPVLSKTEHLFPNLGLRAIEVRTLDPDRGLVHREAFLPDGTPVDVDALRMREQAAKIAAREKISPELHSRMETAAAGAGLPVAFWLAAPGAPDLRGIIRRSTARGSTAEEARRSARAAAEAFFRPRTFAFAGLLEARGIPVDYTGPCWPIVIARVPVEAIPALAARPEVDQAYYAFPAWEGENTYAQPTLRTPTVHRRGNKGGAGAVKVMVQDSGGNVVEGNPYLPPVIKLTPDGPDSHATAVAGNVCMRGYPSLFGCAPELEAIYTAAGWGDTGAPAAWDLAIQAGVSFGNCSWWNFNKGSIVFLDRFFDYIIRNYGVLMFKSNGNQGNTSEPYSTSPGNGYNMVSTGCYNDGDTFKWDDDAMASYSSYWNPVEGHEKPEVASPGDGVDTTGTSYPWIYHGFGGTSSASPLTMGTAVLVANRAPALVTHPEAVKAILMVSAWHNVEGDPVISEKDGAGGVHAGAADAVARDGQFETGVFTAASFPYDRQIFCHEGDGTRVICLWQSDPDSAYTTDVLKMDLDLVVLDPNQNVVAASASMKNEFELAYFEPAVTGWYTVRLTKQTFLGTEEPYCIAWSTRSDAATAEVLIEGTGQIGTTVDFTFYDPNEYGEFFAGLLSLSTLPDLIDLEKGYIIPVAFDLLAQACVFGYLPGYVGVLDAQGQAAASLAIPAAPGLIGTTVYASMVVLDSRFLPRDTAEAASFTIQ